MPAYGRTFRARETAGKSLAKLMGVNSVAQALRTRRRKHLDAAHRGIIKAAEYGLRQSNYLVPVEFGPLQESGHIEVKKGGASTEASIVYSAEYASYVHERLDLAHGQAYNIKWADDIAAGRKTPREPQQQAKFLETVIRTKRKYMLQIVRREIAKVR